MCLIPSARSFPSRSTRPWHGCRFVLFVGMVTGRGDATLRISVAGCQLLVIIKLPHASLFCELIPLLGLLWIDNGHPVLRGTATGMLGCDVHVSVPLQH